MRLSATAAVRKIRRVAYGLIVEIDGVSHHLCCNAGIRQSAHDDLSFLFDQRCFILNLLHPIHGEFAVDEIRATKRRADGQRANPRCNRGLLHAPNHGTMREFLAARNDFSGRPGRANAATPIPRSSYSAAASGRCFCRFGNVGKFVFQSRLLWQHISLAF